MIQPNGNPSIQEDSGLPTIAAVNPKSSTVSTAAVSTPNIQRVQSHAKKVSTNILNAPINKAVTSVTSETSQSIVALNAQPQSTAKTVIDFSVPATVTQVPSNPAPGTLLPGNDHDMDRPSTERLLESANFCFNRRDFKACARLIEKALPAIDRLYNESATEKLQALQLLRDSYLALNKGMEAKDCAEVIITVFEDIMAHNHKAISNFDLGTPTSQTRLVVRKLKTMRRAKDSEFLRRTAAEVSDRWAAYLRA